MGPIVVTELLAHVVATATLALLLVAAHYLIVATDTTRDPTVTGFRRRGVKALVIGADGRASTSKVQVVLWTFAVLYALSFLLIWGRSIGCDESREEICRRAAITRTTFDRLVEAPLDTEYYALLGLPTLAAVAAKKMTETRVSKGEMIKKSVDEAAAGDHDGRAARRRDNSGVRKALAEVITNDRGETDLIDFQYFAFNIVALGYFVLEFIDKPSGGLPEIPPTLLALSGVAVAAYTGKKALEKDTHPVVTAVLPRRLRLSAGTAFTVTGSGFGPADPDAHLLVGWMPTPVDRWTGTRIDATLTPAALAEFRDLGATADIAVMQRDGTTSAPYPVELVGKGHGG